MPVHGSLVRHDHNTLLESRLRHAHLHKARACAYLSSSTGRSTGFGWYKYTHRVGYIKGRFVEKRAIEMVESDGTKEN